VVDVASDLGDEQVLERVCLEQPAHADVGLGVERCPVPGIEPRRRLQQDGRIGGRLGEVDHVPGVHPTAGHVDPLAFMRSE
jgi:hypothetical protein